MAKIDGYELKPCPFCGGNDLAIEKDDFFPYLVVVCMNRECSTTGPIDLGQSGAIERWNTRAQEAE